MGGPEVSFAMSVSDYNNDYLGEAIDSMLCQTFEDFELVIVDGGSVDGTTERISSLKDGRINHVVLDHNPGLPQMRRLAVEKARGRFIAIHDGDDISRPNRLEKQMKFMDENPNISVLGTSVRFIDGNGNITGSLIVDYDHERVMKELKYGSAFAHGSSLMRSEVIKDHNYDPLLPKSHDYDVWLRIAKDGYKFRAIPDALYYYRLHDQNISKGWELQFACAEFARLRCEGQCVEDIPQVMKIIKKSISMSRMRFISRCHKNKFYSDEPIASKIYDALMILITEPSYWLNEISKKIENINMVEPIDYSEWKLCPNCCIMSVPPGERVCNGCKKDNFWWLG